MQNDNAEPKPKGSKDYANTHHNRWPKHGRNKMKIYNFQIVGETSKNVLPFRAGEYSHTKDRLRKSFASTHNKIKFTIHYKTNT